MRARGVVVPTAVMTAFRVAFDPDEAIALGAMAYADQPLSIDEGFADRILLSIRVEESNDALGLLERLDQPVDQDAIEASIPETDAIVVMLVEGVHGRLQVLRSPGSMNSGTPLRASPACARSAPITSQGLCPSPISRVTGISRAGPLAG
jgi:hypothetical protein